MPRLYIHKDVPAPQLGQSELTEAGEAAWLELGGHRQKLFRAEVKQDELLTSRRGEGANKGKYTVVLKV